MTLRSALLTAWLTSSLSFDNLSAISAIEFLSSDIDSLRAFISLKISFVSSSIFSSVNWAFFLIWEYLSSRSLILLIISSICLETSSGTAGAFFGWGWGTGEGGGAEAGNCCGFPWLSACFLSAILKEEFF